VGLEIPLRMETNLLLTHSKQQVEVVVQFIVATVMLEDLVAEVVDGL
jgi:hypothetical protein